MKPASFESGAAKVPTRVVWMARRDRWFPTVAGILLGGVAWTMASAVPAAAVTGGRILSPRAGFLAPDELRLACEYITLNPMRWALDAENLDRERP